MSSLRLITAVGLAGVMALSALAFAPNVLLQAQPHQQPRSNESQCTGTVTGTLSANTIRVCDPLTVTVDMAAECPVCPGGVNVVYIQMDIADQGDWMIQESLSSLGVLRELATGYPVNVGVVRYADNVRLRTALQLTPNVNAAIGALSEPVADGWYEFGPYEAAARTALSMLARARSASNDNSAERCEFIVLFAFGKPTTRRALLSAASMINSANVNLFVGCPSDNMPYCTSAKGIVRSLRDYTEFNERGKLRRMFDEAIAELTDDRGVRELHLTQFLSSGLTYVNGSANVPLARQDRMLDGRTRLDWEWKKLTSTAPQTVTYQASPLREGVSVISGTLRLIDRSNLQREMVMPTMAVTVSDLCLPEPSPTLTDTPTATSVPTIAPTDTSTWTPTPSRTATSNPTPTDTSTPAPQPIYLPVLLSERCTIQWVYSDVVLVMDMSTSMNQRIGGDRTKLEATLDAADQFLAIMDFTPDAGGRSDRVAVVGFNAKAWTESGLTNDVGMLSAALDRLPAGQDQFTRMDLGFDVGLDVLRPALGQPNTTPVMVFLTDGLPNRVPLDPDDGTMETTVRKAAQKVKDAGVRVYTIGIGLPEDINGMLMRQCATLPANYFYTPDPEALAGIYAKIAYSFGCPTGRHDWGRPWP